jgi:hypothetical protein
MKKKDYKKDDIITILLAFLVEKDAEEGYVDINSLYDMANKIVKLATLSDSFDDYEFPDLSVPSLKKNKYVQRVALNGDVVFKMKFEEALDIARRNLDVAMAIQSFSVVDTFSDKVESIESGEFKFHPKDPNDIYVLFDDGYGLEKETSALYTDGKVTELDRDKDGNFQFKVEGSTYTIVTEQVGKRVEYGAITSNIYDLRYLNCVYDDLMSIIKGVNSYSKQDSKVYLKRRS